jgi:hypothetical protein
MDIRFDFVVCTHLCAAERLAHSPRKRQNEWRARQSERRFKSRRVEPVRPPPDRHARSHMQRRLLHVRVRRFEGSAKIAKYSDEWYLSPPHRVGSKSKHSQVPVLRPRHRAHRERDAPHPPQRQGRGRRALPSLPRLAVRCLSPARSPAHSRTAWHGLARTEADPEARRGPACVLSPSPTHRLPFRHRRGWAA